MAYIWDIISVVIIAISIYVGVKRGFVRSLISVACYIVALLGAQYASPIIGAKIYSGYLSGVISRNVVSQINSAVATGAVSGGEILTMLPQWVEGVITRVKPDFLDMSFSIAQSGATEEMAQTIANSITASLEAPLTQIISWFAFILLFFLILLVLKWVAKLFTHVNRIPIVGTINMLLGGGLGIVLGVVSVLLVAIAANGVAFITNNQYPVINSDAVSESIIIGSLYRWFLK